MCSSYLAALKYQDYKMDRVCQTCFENLTGNKVLAYYVGGLKVSMMMYHVILQHGVAIP